MQIEVKVQGQKIERLNSPGAVEDTLNYLTCYFTFDGEEWDNTVKTAYFRNPASGKTYSQILAEDNICTVPWEALTDKGFVRFSVAGEREDYRITTNVESFCNSGTIYGGNPSEPPTPDQYDQMIALAERTKEIAESVRRDADEGKFDGDPGEPGKPGDPGKDGVSPSAKVEQTNDGAVITVTDATGTTTAKLKNGKDGNPGQDATDEQVQAAVDAYMEEHPVQVDTDDLIKIAIKEEASGAVPVVIADSAEMGAQDMKMQGWTEQDSTEGKNLLDNTKDNISNWVIGRGLSYSASPGTIIRYDPRTYRASVIVDGIKPNTTYSFKNLDKTKIWVDRIILADDNSLGYQNVALYNNVDTQNHNEYKFTTKDDENITCAYFQVRTLPNEDGENISITENDVLNMQVCFSEGEPIYEPYTGGKPSPSPEYPQPITNAGKYNEEVQKWEYEITIANEQTDPDKNQTVTLTSDRPLTKWDKLEKRDGVWGWVYKSAEIVLDGSEDEKWTFDNYITNKYTMKLPDGIIEKNTFGYCNHFIFGIPYEVDRIGINVNAILWITINWASSDLALWKNYLAQNPITVIYQTAEETFVPLTESEQEALNALRTYYPTTILDNDQECDMALTYIADTKAYIDNKVSAIQAAIANTI